MAQNNDNNEKKDNGLNIVAIIEDFIGKIRDFKIVDLIKLLISFLSKIKLKLIIIGIIIGSIVLIILAVITWGTVEEIFDKVKETFTDINNKVTIVDNNIEIDQAYWQEAEQKLRQMGVSTTSLGLNGDEELLQKILEAEIVTYFPYLGGDDLQGTVYFERATVDGNKTELQYIGKDDFYNRLNSGDSSLINYFTLDEEDWTVHVIKNSNEGINQNNVEKIDYRSMVNKFAMPFEFPLALALITQNPNFILAVIDLAQESRMVVTIAESKVVTNTVIRESYVETKTVTNRETGELLDEYTTSRRVEQIVDEYEEVEYSTQILLSSVRAWVANQVTDLTPPSAEVYEAEPIVNSFPNESSNTIATMENSGIPLLASQNGNFNLHTEQTDKRQRTEVTTTSYIWNVGVTKKEDKLSNFLELLINDNAAIGGRGGLVEIAKNCHDYLSENGYKYATPGGHHFPDTGSKTIDCSAYVSWVLREAGYDDIGMQSSESLPNIAEQKGWLKIDNMEDLQPGDICFYDGHVNIFVKRDGENYLFYDCGSDTAIAAKDPIVYDAEGRGFKFAYRLNDEIAQKLSVNTPEALEESIENYISTIKFGDWSVSVRNSKGTEEISINNSQQTSDGFLKLFIMAATYNEVKEGNLEEDTVTPYIEEMMRANNNEAANKLIEMIGSADIEQEETEEAEEQDTENPDYILAGLEKINAFIEENGYAYTDIGNIFALDNTNYTGDESNFTSVRGVTYLLNSIENNKCVNRKYSEKMKEMLALNNAMTAMIPETIQGGTVYNKEERLAYTVGDSAIVEIGNKYYIVAITANNITDQAEATNAVKQISTMIYQYYSQENSKSSSTNNEIDTVMDGNRVCYWVPDQSAYVSPLINLIDDGSGMLFELLASSEKTQNHETLMRYVLYLITGNSYGVTEFNVEQLFSPEFSSISGIYGSTSEEKVWFALLNAGYTKEGAAGILGNLQVESHFNPTAESSAGYYGIVQWDKDGRKQNLINYCNQNGLDYTTLEGQIQFMIYELQTDYKKVSDYLKTTTDSPELTAQEVACGYEGCIGSTGSNDAPYQGSLYPNQVGKTYQALGSRKSYALQYYEQFKDLEAPTGGEVANGGAGTIGTYTSTKGRKFNMYLQGSGAPWANNDYGNDHSMAKAGCGPTALATIASGYNGQITPETTRQATISRYGTGNHSSAIFMAQVWKDIGMTVSAQAGSIDKSRMINCLSNGGQIWLVVKNCKYTKNSHCIALIDYNASNGQVYVSHGSAKSTPYGWESIDYIIQYNKSEVLYIGG